MVIFYFLSKKKHLLFSFILSICLNSCVHSDDYSIAPIVCEEPLIKNKTSLEQLHFSSNQTIQKYKKKDTLSGYVISSDAAGNFYKSIYIQSENRSFGMEIPVDITNNHTFFSVGRKIHITLENLYYQKKDNALRLGSLYQGKIGRISKIQADHQILRSCKTKIQDSLYTTVSIKDIDDSFLHRLVRIENVQFLEKEIGQPFYTQDKDSGGATNRILRDKNGYTIAVRTSAYADFASNRISDKNATITAIVTKYADTYQLLIRDDNDIVLDQSRDNYRQIAIATLYKNTNHILSEKQSYIQGVVTLSGYADNHLHNSANLSSYHCIVQDKSGAILVKLSTLENTFLEGDLLRININTAKINHTSLGLQLSEITDIEKNITVLGNNQEQPTPKQASIAAIAKGEFPLQRVTLANMQFIDTLTTYKGTQKITDCTNTLLVYTMGKARFSDMPVAQQRGSITGIAFSNTSPTIRLQNIAETTMKEQRCIMANTIFFEDFETPKNQALWYIFSEKNTGWQSASYSNNTYMQASAYQAKQAVESWLISPELPIFNTQNPLLKLKYKQNFYNADVVMVYGTTDYISNTNPKNHTWTLLGDSSIFLDKNPNGFMSSFSDATIAIPGNITHIAFVYKGDAKQNSTTNFQLDAVSITE